MSEILGTIRASSWSELFDCGLRWYYKNVEGLRFPPRGATQIGTAIHKGTAVFDRAFQRNDYDSMLIEAAVAAAVDAIERPTTEKGDPVDVIYDEEMSQREATSFAVNLTAKYCQTVAPHKRYSAIEVKCVGLEVATEHGIVKLTGTTDRVEVGADGEGVRDLKSGAKAVGADGVAVTAGHHLQAGAYTLMTEAEIKRPLGNAKIIGFQTSKALRIGEGTIENPKRALVGDGDRPGMIEIAAAMLKSGLFPPNPKSILCSAKWCPAHSRCPYHA